MMEKILVKWAPDYELHCWVNNTSESYETMKHLNSKFEKKSNRMLVE